MKKVDSRKDPVKKEDLKKKTNRKEGGAYPLPRSVRGGELERRRGSNKKTPRRIIGPWGEEPTQTCGGIT